MKKNNEGFTLVELLAVITVLGIIAVIAYPLVTGTISNSKKKLLKEQKKIIEDAAKNYSVKNTEVNCECITVEELQNSGYLESGKAVDPNTGEPLDGFVTIKWKTNKNQYGYTYGETCNCKNMDDVEEEI